MPEIKFNNEVLWLKKSQYAGRNGRIALLANDNEGYPYLTATVNLPDYEIPTKSHTFIKNWSENSGILKVLVDAKIVEDTGITVPTGFVSANLVKVLI